MEASKGCTRQEMKPHLDGPMDLKTTTDSPPHPPISDLPEQKEKHVGPLKDAASDAIFVDTPCTPTDLKCGGSGQMTILSTPLDDGVHGDGVQNGLLCARGKFSIAETPGWRQEDKKTSDMIKEIADMRARILSAADSDWRVGSILKSFKKRQAVQFVLLSNQMEGEGTQTLEDTLDTLESLNGAVRRSHPEPKTVRATQNIATVMQELDVFREEVRSDTSDTRDICVDSALVTVSLLESMHRKLLNGLHHKAGTIRSDAEVELRSADGHVYPEAYHVEPYLYAATDAHFGMMQEIRKADHEKPEELMTELFKLAGRIMFDVVNIHPFYDGNGRMCRLIANHVLATFCPFPVAAVPGDEFVSKPLGKWRETYLACIKQARTDKLHRPSDLAALLVDGAWCGWKKCLQAIEYEGLLSDRGCNIGPLIIVANGSPADLMQVSKLVESRYYKLAHRMRLKKPSDETLEAECHKVSCAVQDVVRDMAARSERERRLTIKYPRSHLTVSVRLV